MTLNYQPLITVIIPIYNVHLYLSKCLDSVLNQTYSNLEVLLIDDGSQDGSKAIASEFEKKDSRIRLIKKKNSGVSDTRNVGIKMAKGEYICFSDADDILSPDYVEYLFKLINSSNYDIALTTRMFSNYSKAQIKKINVEKLNSEKACVNILSYNIPIGVYCKLFKTKFLRENNILFNNELFMGEGFNFNIDAFQRTDKIISSNRKIYFYRRNNSTSATTKFSITKCENELEAISAIYSNFILKSKSIENAWRFARWRTYSDVFDILVLSKNENNFPDLYKECLQIIRRDGAYSLKAPVSNMNRLRALIMVFFPKMIPWTMLKRNKIFKVQVKH